MPTDLQTEVERFVVAWLLDMLNRFHRDPRQEKEFEREVAMLASIAFTGEDGLGRAGLCAWKTLSLKRCTVASRCPTQWAPPQPWT